MYWSINDEDVATCGSPTYMGCSVHGNEVGSAILTAESVDGGYSASCKITVVTHCVTGISIPDEESEVSLGIGLSKQVQANVLPENADNQNIIWSSSNSDIVSVDDNGVITGVGNGSATITATTDEGGYQATCNVSTYVPVSDIELSESSLILAKGSSQIVYAAVSPENVDEEHRKLKYDVTANDVVRVRYFYDNDPQGCLIIGYETGQTRVEVSTAEGHVKKYIDVTVVVPVKGITVQPVSKNMHVGDKLLLNRNVYPFDATNKTIIWSSSNEDVATVDENGQITAMKAGVATINATTNDGGLTAACTVKVSHAWNEEYTVDNEATCTEEGILEKVCVDCGDVVTETIDAAGHTWGTEYTIDKEPTYTEEGSESIHCSVCGEIDQSTVRAIPSLPVGWKEDENGWRYQRTDGTYVKSRFEVIDGNTYYFNESEYRVTGLQTIDSKKYYFTDDGVMQTGWQTIDSKKYYFNDEGVMHTGWLKLNGKYYYFKETGQMVTGRYKIGNKWYTFNSNGVRQ